MHVDGDFKAEVEKLDNYPMPEDLLLRLELTDTNLDPYADRTVTPSVFSGFKAFLVKKAEYPEDRVNVRNNGWEHFVEGDTVNSLIDAVARVSVKWNPPAEVAVPALYMSAFGRDGNSGWYFLECTYLQGEADDNGYFTWTFTRPVDITLHDEVAFVVCAKPIRRTGGDISTETSMSAKDAETLANAAGWNMFAPDPGMDISVIGSPPLYGWVWDGTVWSETSPLYCFNYNSALDRTFLRRDSFNGIKTLAEAADPTLPEGNRYIVLFTKDEAVKLRELLSTTTAP